VSSPNAFPTRAKGRAKYRTPGELLRRDARNTRIHLPRVDYSDISVGAKREYRNYGYRRFDGLSFPAPAVGYCARDWWTPTSLRDGIDTCLLTIEDSWVEPLGAISPESLANEGFTDIADFRRYFTERYPRGGFRALANVVVYRVHPMTVEEAAEFAAAHWSKMYGQYA
jgi:hypothetical protein